MTRKHKLLAALVSVLILAALGWAVGVRHPYAFEIVVELEANGEPVVIRRTIRCIPESQSQGIGSRTLRFYVSEIGSFGTQLRDGSGVFLTTPSVCGLRRDDRAFAPIDPNYLPLIGWTQTPDDPQTFEMYLTREAVTAPGRRVRLQSLRVGPAASMWAAWRPSALDDFAWFWQPPDRDDAASYTQFYRGFFFACVDPSNIHAKLLEAGAGTLSVLEGEARVEAGLISQKLRPANDLLPIASDYERESNSAFEGARSEGLVSGLIGLGMPPHPTPGEARSSQLRTINYTAVSPLRRRDARRLVDWEANGTLTMERVPTSELFNRDYDLLPIVVDDSEISISRKFEVISRSADSSLCFLSPKSVRVAKNVRR
jgi:hypothetical protein